MLLGSQYVAAGRARPRQHAASLLHKAVWVFVLLFSPDIASLLLEGDRCLCGKEEVSIDTVAQES